MIVQDHYGTIPLKVFGSGTSCGEQMLQMLPPVVIQNRQTDGLHCTTREMPRL